MRKVKSAAERFWIKVDKTGDCWLWTASTAREGYGKFSLDGISQYAHRVSYVWAHGEIPADLVVDHKCKVRNCVRPTHLRLLTRAENTSVGNTKPLCSNGHDLNNPDNVYLIERKKGKRAGQVFRMCKICSSDRSRKRGSANIEGE